MYSIEQLEKVGGKLWEKGAMRRVYFNDLAALIDLEVEKYGTGNISGARHNGEKISNAEAGRILAGLGKIWYDLEKGAFAHRASDAFVKPEYRDYGSQAIKALTEKLENQND